MHSFLSKKILYRSIFSKTQMAPPDPILGVNIAFIADHDLKKVNLGVGAYRNDNMKPEVFKIVRKVEHQILNDHSLDKEYLPIDGLHSFNLAAQKLIFGSQSQLIKQGRIITAQSLSGTGALRIGFELIKQQCPANVLIPNPTWTNHQNIITRSGLNYQFYPYYDPATKKVKINDLLNFLQNSKQKDIVLLHACAHNPTGADLSIQQWQKVADIMQKKKLVPFFDSAYQGFATGSLQKDAQSIRYFASRGFQMFVAQSLAKNMGLYGKRIGALHIVTKDKLDGQKALSQLKNVIRASYSSPPLSGARIAQRILNSQKNYHEWTVQLKNVSHRILNMRKMLRGHLQQLKTPGDWSHITQQIGMFTYTGLTQNQCNHLITKNHIYMLKNGRIAMTGLTTKNIDYVAECINEVVRNIK